MDDVPIFTDQAPPQEWLEALAEAEADFAAGRFVEGATLMRELDEVIAEMQAEITGASR